MDVWSKRRVPKSRPIYAAHGLLVGCDQLSSANSCRRDSTWESSAPRFIYTKRAACNGWCGCWAFYLPGSEKWKVLRLRSKRPSSSDITERFCRQKVNADIV